MSPRAPRTLRLGSFNIRRDGAAAHPLLHPFAKLATTLITVGGAERERWGERSWAERREKLVDQVLWSQLEVVGFQEALDNQLNDLKELMGSEWDHVGVGRDDGKKKGEAVPIFFRKSRLSLLEVQHFWLSPIPTKVGSIGWDAGQTRMVTIARFRDSLASSTSSPKTADIVVANTHWDDRGLEARSQSGALIIKLIEEEVLAPIKEKNEPEPLVVLLGDLNSVAEEKGYQVLTAGRYGGKKEDTRGFRDARHEIATRRSKMAGPGAMSGRFGPLNTFTGFLPSDVPKIIDFIMPFSNAAFVDPSKTPSSPPPPASEQPADKSLTTASSKPAGSCWKVARYGVVPNFSEDIDGKRGDAGDAMVISDHRLVVAMFEEVIGAEGKEA
ncbi:hypothetical protein JCM8547_008563 [Rhodosporidiobolus lusitaniae]